MIELFEDFCVYLKTKKRYLKILLPHTDVILKFHYIPPGY